MKNIIYPFLFFGTISLLGSCKEESFEELVPEQYGKILYLKTYGQQTLNLFDDGNQVDYSLSVVKTGSNPQALAEAEVKVMSQKDIDDDSRYRGNNYKVLSANCYDFKSEKLIFGSSDTYKNVNLKISPSKILEEMEATQSENPNYVYILPFRLHSQDNVNVEKRDQILKLNVTKLGITFKKGSQEYNLNQMTGDEWPFEVLMNMVSGVHNNWNFDANIEIDRSDKVLNEYNTLNGTSYSMIPEQSIESTAEGRFESGNNEAAAIIRIKRDGLLKGFTYLIPVKMKPIQDMETMGVSDKMHYIILEYPLDPENDRIELNVSMLSDPFECGENGVTGDCTVLDNLVDNNNETYYHTNYNKLTGNAEYGQPVDITLKETIKSLQIGYTTRHNNSSVCPTLIKIFVSNDKATWTEIANLNEGLPTGTAQNYTSKVLTSDKAFKHIRFSVMSSPKGQCNGTLTGNENPCWALAELRIWGSK